MSDWCEGGNKFVDVKLLSHEEREELADKMGGWYYSMPRGWELHPPGISEKKRHRIKCPVCGRKLVLSISSDDDQMELVYTIPPHKVKGWKRKPKKSRKEKHVRRK